VAVEVATLCVSEVDDVLADGVWGTARCDGTMGEGKSVACAEVACVGTAGALVACTGIDVVLPSLGPGDADLADDAAVCKSGAERTSLSGAAGRDLALALEDRTAGFSKSLCQHAIRWYTEHAYFEPAVY
jgi:hypothetical protein